MIDPGAFKPVKWKNGKGVSLEIAAEPAGASVNSENLLWRLALARMTEAAPFSSYPGFSRFLSLTEGSELRLERASGQILLRPGDIYHLEGEEEVSGLPTGSVADVGLIYRRGQVKALMEALDFTGRSRSFRLESRQNFFYIVSGKFAASCYPGEARFSLEAGMVLRVDGSGPVEHVVLLEPLEKSGRVLTAEISW
jgi:environmental stress-induced protein Ves